MPKQKKVCRVCGNTYSACNSARIGDGVFRWQEVACSPECGAKYLKMIQKSRAKKTVKNIKPKVVEPTIEESNTTN